MARHREWKDLIEAIDAAGWRKRPCKHGTYVYPPHPNSRPITIPGTPSEYRGPRNIRAALRRAGLPDV